MKWIFRTAKAIPIAGAKENRSDAARVRRGRCRAGRGRCIFPRALTTDGEMAPFKSGVEGSSSAARCPVVPMALRNMWAACGAEGFRLGRSCACRGGARTWRWRNAGRWRRRDGGNAGNGVRGLRGDAACSSPSAQRRGRLEGSPSPDDAGCRQRRLRCNSPHRCSSNAAHDIHAGAMRRCDVRRNRFVRNRCPPSSSMTNPASGHAKSAM